jgi:hypothetical protein
VARPGVAAIADTFAHDTAVSFGHENRAPLREDRCLTTVSPRDHFGQVVWSGVRSVRVTKVCDVP